MKIWEDLSSKYLKLHAALEMLDEGLLVVDEQGKFLFSNHSAQKIIQTELIGKSPTEWCTYYGVFELDMVTPIDHENIPLKRAMKGEDFTDQRIFYRNLTSNEGYFLSCNGKPLKDDSRIVGAVLTFRDITESVIKDNLLQKEKKLFDLMMDYIPGLVYTKTLDGRYTYANKKFRDFLNSGESVEGKTLYDLVDKKLADKLMLHDLIVRNSKKPLEFDEAVTKNGKRTIFHNHRFPILDSSNNVVALGGMSWDNTQKVEQEIQLDEERLKSASASRLAAIGLLSAEIGHEINNPLSVIKTSNKVLKKMLDAGEPKEKLVEHLEMIDQTILRVTEIVKALSNASRDTSDEGFTLSSLQEILKDFIVISNFRIKSKGIKFIKEIRAPQELRIHCFKGQLTEVFLNLIGNACDAAEASQDPWIKMEISADDEKIYFAFSDSGKGVPKEIRKSIFNSFFTTKEMGRGTGLGLSISKNILLKHHGEIYLQEETPNTFIVTLPLNVA